jgi:succinyl-diaminopimelate desuccinylase
MSISSITKFVDEQELINLTSELVKIPSITGNEGAIAEFLEGKMRALGLTTNRYEPEAGRPNIVGILHGTEGNPKIILNGHMDTVPPGNLDDWTFEPYGGEVQDGKLYGRGSCDMKGGIASTLMAVKAIVDSGTRLKGDIIFSPVVDEERGGYKGTKYLVDKGILGDQALIAEPSQLNILIAHKGDLGLDLTIHGKAAHAANPDMGLNAIHKMTYVIDNILRIPKTFNWDRKIHRLVGPPTIGISVINGGLQRNMVPDKCSCIIDRRVVPVLESIDEARREIVAEVDRLKSLDPQLKAEIKTLLEVEACEIKEEEQIVQTLRSCFREYMQREPKITGVSYFTDAHFLVNQAGIPTAMFGPGSIDRAHAVDEYVEVDQLIDASKIYAQTLAKLLR